MGTTSLSLFDLVPGKALLERYEIVRPHRQGGMSAAFEVKDREADGARRELQVFLGSLFEDHPQSVEFAERLAPWVGLSSPSVVQLHDLHTLDDGSVLYVSDFPPGVSLRALMGQEQRMQVGEAVRFAKSLLRGLVDVHGAGLVHGDIKPAAIQAGEDRASAVLLDGGITPGLWAAKHLGTRTALIGTPFYAPIEQFTGDSPDELSDLYNVATVLFELVAGVLPWTGKSYVEVFQSKMQKTPPRLRDRAPGLDVPEDLEGVIAHGLSPVRKERYASADAFLSDLGAIDLS